MRVAPTVALSCPEARRADEGDILLDADRGDQVVGLADHEVVVGGGVEVHRELAGLVGGFAVDDA